MMAKFVPLTFLKDTTSIVEFCQECGEPVFVTRNGTPELVIMDSEFFNEYLRYRKEDGKLDLSLREKAYIQMSIDAEKVMKKLQENKGVLPFTDKASPELIREQMDMSKNEFKRAVGNLLKAGKLEITHKDIRQK